MEVFSAVVLEPDYVSVSVSVSSDIGEGTRTVVDSLTAIPLLGDERALGEVP